MGNINKSRELAIKHLMSYVVRLEAEKKWITKEINLSNVALKTLEEQSINDISPQAVIYTSSETYSEAVQLFLEINTSEWWRFSTVAKRLLIGGFVPKNPKTHRQNVSSTLKKFLQEGLVQSKVIDLKKGDGTIKKVLHYRKIRDKANKGTMEIVGPEGGLQDWKGEKNEDD